MSDPELDAAYSPSRTVDSLDHYLWLYGDLSEVARRSFGERVVADLAYGPHDRQAVDLYPCDDLDRGEQAPLVVFIHGGFWQALSRQESSFAASACRSHRMHFAALGYRLAPEASLPEIVADVHDGLTMLRDRADELGIDPEAVVVVGHSAGAHLAATAACDPRLDLAGVVLLGGVFDLEPVRRSYVNDAVGMRADQVADLSPIQDTPRPGTTVIVRWAEYDTAAFAQQSRDLIDAWSSHDKLIDAGPQLGLNHFNSPLELRDPHGSLMSAIMGVVGAAKT